MIIVAQHNVYWNTSDKSESHPKRNQENFRKSFHMHRANATTIYAQYKNIVPRNIDSQEFIQNLVKRMISALLQRRQMWDCSLRLKMTSQLSLND